MKDLSEHLTDIVQNSTRAGARLVEIQLSIDSQWLHLTILDNGSGMSAELLQRVTDPFATTRTTRKVGMGLALLRQSAEQTGGQLSIESSLGVGTRVQATFRLQHWDMLPHGDLPAALAMLIGGNPQVDFLFRYQAPELEPFELDTRELREVFDDIPLSNLSAMKMIKELIASNLEPSSNP